MLVVQYSSDHGVQYSSSEYVDELKSHGFEIGMTRTGNPYNAMIDSFFRTLGYNKSGKLHR